MVKQTWKGLQLSQSIWIGHDLSMCILYWFHGWFIFARVIALFMFVWPYMYVRPHILCTQLVICLLSMTSCVHKMCERTYGQTNMKRAYLLPKLTIREIGIICACSDHGQPRYQIWIKCNKRQMTSCVHKMCDAHPYMYVRPHILCTQLVICLLSHFIHIWYLGWPWSEHVHIIPISRMVDFCKS
jgi:hypothetical protein